MNTLIDPTRILCSISPRRDCWDNAVAESFFSTLKSDIAFEALELMPELAGAQVVDYIDNYYNSSTS